MAALSQSRGHRIIYRGGAWRYVDTDAKLENGERACKRCGREPTEEGYDACLGELVSVISACCGHGVVESFVVKEKQ